MNFLTENVYKVKKYSLTLKILFDVGTLENCVIKAVYKIKITKYSVTLNVNFEEMKY